MMLTWDLLGFVGACWWISIGSGVGVYLGGDGTSAVDV